MALVEVKNASISQFWTWQGAKASNERVLSSTEKSDCTWSMCTCHHWVSYSQLTPLRGFIQSILSISPGCLFYVQIVNISHHIYSPHTRVLFNEIPPQKAIIFWIPTDFLILRFSSRWIMGFSLVRNCAQFILAFPWNSLPLDVSLTESGNWIEFLRLIQSRLAFAVWFTRIYIALPS